jgi:FkbH-like protein
MNTVEAPLRLTIAANFVAEPVEPPLRYLLRELALPAELHFAPFDQVMQQLLDRGSRLRHACDYGVIFLQLERWSPEPDRDSATLRRNVRDFADALLAAEQSGPTVFFVLVSPISPARQADAELRAQEDWLRGQFAGANGIEFIGHADTAALYPVEPYSNWFDAYTERLAQIPYSPLGFTVLSTMVARRLFRRRTRSPKVIVVDCDNTLWSGECGEDGPANVKMTSGRQLLQRFLLKQVQGGRLLCLCSKNHEPNVLEVFARHEAMPLQREHLTAWRINWQPKPENLRALSAELSLGLDSFVFLDDDTFECESVRALCPEVLTLQVPRDDAQIELFLREVWELDLRPPTLEDERRAQYYRDNAEREKIRGTTASLDDFIASLQLQVEIAPLTPKDFARAAQLVERTNQFNLNGVRRSAAELQALLATAGRECRLIRALDRFGDYGAVGLVIYCVRGETLDVETLLLSCRALGKGIEAHLATHILNAAQSAGVAEIAFDYRPTPKNGLIPSFLAEFGAGNTDGRWRRRFRERRPAVASS